MTCMHAWWTDCTCMMDGLDCSSDFDNGSIQAVAFTTSGDVVTASDNHCKVM